MQVRLPKSATGIQCSVRPALHQAERNRKQAVTSVPSNQEPSLVAAECKATSARNHVNVYQAIRIIASALPRPTAESILTWENTG